MNEAVLELPPRKLAFLGAFLPRRSRASQITTWLFNAFAAEYGNCECLALAMSDVPRRYRYPSRVRFEIAQTDENAYRSAADFLNLNDIDLVCIQHDYQIFDGDAGSFILTFARALKMPVVSVLRQVQPAPCAALRQVIAELARLSSRVIVLQRGAVDTLQAEYGVARDKVAELILPDGEGEEQTPEGFPEDEPTWREAARCFMECFQDGRRAAAQKLAQNIDESSAIPVTGSGGDGLPVLKLDYFLRMTDETGLLKASVLSLPDYRQGYTTADNARALMFSLLLEQVGEGPFIPIEMQASRHMAFLWNAFNPERERFRDAMSYRREWLDEEGSEDTHGLAVWSLGMALGRSTHLGMLGVARQLFEAALPAAKQFSSLRGWAFSLLGIQEYLERFSGDRAVGRTGKLLLDRLVSQFEGASSPDWPWFEEAMAAGSASVSQALIASARWVGETRAAEIGLKTLDWLAGLQFNQDGMFAPLGDQGYHRRGGRPARFAQRPVEARGMIAACLEAYRFSHDERWIKYARGSFHWFLGRNELGRPLYDPETGGCCDGLLYGKVDPNFSAESLLAFLMAQLEIRLFDQLYRQRSSTSLGLPILQIGSPNPLIQSSGGERRDPYALG